MCGIAGYIFPPQKSKPEWAHEKCLSDMLQLIHHRGPDGQGIEAGDGYGLGHVRLSILDTSNAAHQPMWSKDKRYCLIYNGELYNFKSLKQDLKSKGYNFISDGDTEVLLYALIHWNKNAFSQLEGMFAGVLYDTQEQTALIFRDQLGIKPLYYSFQNDAFVFASEVKALKPILKSFSINNASIYEYTNFRYVAGENTLFQNIKRLLPGHCIEISKNGDTKFHKFYDVLGSLYQSSPDPELDQIEQVVCDSIKAHTLSDVGYSIQLSGGIDSTFITNVLGNQQKELDTYSVSLPGQKDDEKEYQDIVAQKCGTIHHDYPCDAELFADLLPKASYHLDFPIMHAGSVYLYYLCQEIGKTHKVVLTGEGADELFLGYSRYDIPLSHKLAFQIKKMGIPASFIPDLPKLRGLKKLMQQPLGLNSGMFDSNMLERMLPDNLDKDINYRQTITEPFSSLTKKIIASDQCAYLGSLLERQDKVSMGSSVEARVPFCNHKLFDLINPLSFKFKTDPAPKAILKKLLEKDYDHDFVYRRKVGFRLPIDEWIANPKHMGRYVDYLRDSRFQNRGIYNNAVISDMIDKHMAGTKNYSRELFGVINLEIWAREFDL